MGLKSKEVMELEAKVVVGTYERAPVVLSSGKGCKLYDPEGREYLDCTSGIAVNALGHGDPDWVRAVTEQAHLLTHVSNVYYSVPQGPRLVEPMHGSAPDIAGQDKANPLVKVLSAALLLKYGLGEEMAVMGIENAVLDTLDRGFGTGDIYSVRNKVLGCKEIGEEVLKSVKSKIPAAVQTEDMLSSD